MRITEHVVRKLSDYAGELTGNEWGLQGVGADIGYGVRYIDKRQQLVWLGRTGAREAASYYAGVIDSAHTGTLGERPADIQAVIRFLVNWRESAVDKGRHDYFASSR